MEYNIKKDNRKKYQDKTRLKRHHKKDYSKVVRTYKPEDRLGMTKDDESDEGSGQSDSESEDLDEEGNVVPKLDADGNAIPRRKKKLQGNAWRYKEELPIDGLDNDDELVAQLDFKKLSTREIDLGKKKKKTLHEMSTDELLGVTIMDPVFDSRAMEKATTDKKTADPLEDLLALPTRKHSTEQSASHAAPVHLLADEAFLDDLL